MRGSEPMITTQIALYIILAYAAWMILNRFGIVRMPTFVKRMARFIYVILHEMSHALVGAITLKGIASLQILPSKTVTQYGNTIHTAGQYQSRRSSPFGIGFFNIGDALTAIAGPVLSPIVVLMLVDTLVRQSVEELIFILGIILVVIILFARERFLILAIGVAMYFMLGDQFSWTAQVAHNIIGVIVIWAVLGMLEEISVLIKYNDRGSDVGQFTKNLIGQDRKWLSAPISILLTIYHTILTIYAIQLFI